MAVNKNAATEDDVGYIHGALTRLFKAKVDALLVMIEDDPSCAAVIVSGKDLQAIAKWVEFNGITATPADMEEINKLTDKVARLKAQSQGKVVSFLSAKEA